MRTDRLQGQELVVADLGEEDGADRLRPGRSSTRPSDRRSQGNVAAARRQAAPAFELTRTQLAAAFFCRQGLRNAAKAARVGTAQAGSPQGQGGNFGKESATIMRSR